MLGFHDKLRVYVWTMACLSILYNPVQFIVLII